MLRLVPIPCSRSSARSTHAPLRYQEDDCWALEKVRIPAFSESMLARYACNRVRVLAQCAHEPVLRVRRQIAAGLKLLRQHQHVVAALQLVA